LRGLYDVRVLIPGYRQVLQAAGPVPVVARLPGAFGIPACDLGRVVTKDGLQIYVLLCPQLYDREGTPYGTAAGVDWTDNDIRFARLALAAADLACGSGDPEWKPDLLHLNDWPSSLASAYLTWRGVRTPSILTYSQPRLSGPCSSARASANSAFPTARSRWTAWNSTASCPS
jgi:starch synthase